MHWRKFEKSNELDGIGHMEEVFVSVIVPTFNREKSILRCLDSIVHQRFKPYEIIVVDDGSTDTTVELLESYACEYLRIIRINHCGAQTARNIGILNAKGNYIAFLDSDDEWLPNLLLKEVEMICEGHGDSVIYSDCFRTYRDTDKRDIWHLPGHSGDMFKFLLERSGPMFQSLLVKRESLIEIGLLDENVPSMQEWETAIRLAEYYRFIHIEEPLFVYYTNGSDSISKDVGRELDGKLYVTKKHRRSIIGTCGANVLAKRLINLMICNIKNMRMRAALSCFFRVLEIPFILY